MRNWVKCVSGLRFSGMIVSRSQTPHPIPLWDLFFTNPCLVVLFLPSSVLCHSGPVVWLDDNNAGARGRPPAAAAPWRTDPEVLRYDVLQSPRRPPLCPTVFCDSLDTIGFGFCPETVTVCSPSYYRVMLFFTTKGKEAQVGCMLQSCEPNLPLEFLIILFCTLVLNPNACLFVLA